MPGLAMDALNGESGGVSGVEESNGSYRVYKDGYLQPRSPRSPLSPQSPRSDSIDLAIDGIFETSIEQLYHNVCEMQSSDHGIQS